MSGLIIYKRFRGHLRPELTSGLAFLGSVIISQLAAGGLHKNETCREDSFFFLVLTESVLKQFCWSQNQKCKDGIYNASLQ